MQYGSDTGAGHYFSGGVISAAPDMRFGLRFNTVDGIVDFDAGDYLYYSRSTDTFLFNIGGTTKATIDSGGVMNVTQLALDGQFYQTVASGTHNPLINFDSNDYLAYDRTANLFAFNVGGILRASIDGSGNIAAGGIFPGNDAAFSIKMVGGTPTILFDSGDTIRYDRANDKFVFGIGGVEVASIDAGGNLRIRGTITQSTTP